MVVCSLCLHECIDIMRRLNLVFCICCFVFITIWCQTVIISWVFFTAISSLHWPFIDFNCESFGSLTPFWNTNLYSRQQLLIFVVDISWWIAWNGSLSKYHACNYIISGFWREYLQVESHAAIVPQIVTQCHLGVGGHTDYGSLTGDQLFNSWAAIFYLSLGRIGLLMHA